MRKLSRKAAHRKSLERNLAASLVLYERIDTTLPKAKEVRRVVERLISRAKKQNLSSYRELQGFFYDRNAAKKVYTELASRYKNRSSGFVKIFRLGNRPGDNASPARVELVDRKVFVAPKKIEKVTNTNKKKEVVSEKTRAEIMAEKRLEKLKSVQQKGGVVTAVRTKAARKTGV